ncbi:hypothetical protein PPSIR1_38554 [Plesiocystis pacifica SIR-1]|uniref:Uncharacterized protein n=1 Tax=Plesiocystis pacifica SIR-1 TaxID=391625 RepID=A6G8N4_9BACT|nr:hypothetical protein [Plesiocystis pacifica]EDM77811.1 hypothetical protein PPSIR1_38554 [Plesiocystis pacifica SIR-1]
MAAGRGPHVEPEAPESEELRAPDEADNVDEVVAPELEPVGVAPEPEASAPAKADEARSRARRSCSSEPTYRTAEGVAFFGLARARPGLSVRVGACRG